MHLDGLPVTLARYPGKAVTNRQFRSVELPALDEFYLAPSMTGLVDLPPRGLATLLEDDNRGAVSADPIATLDGVGFHLSIKGIGSTVDPYSHRSLDPDLASSLTDRPDVRRRLGAPTLPLPPAEPPRLITGEQWLRGSPYGGQGLLHAEIALAVSERADLTSIAGFRIAPVLKIVRLPTEVEDRLRSIHWYRRYAGPFVQEIRLVPSNVRIYFHARSTVGGDVAHVYDTFGLQSESAALAFQVEFVRSVVPMLTLFARTLRRDAATGRYWGLDFHDVWLDKDAALAPNGTVYFVDLEGIEETDVEAGRIQEKVEDQIYRGLYEFVFAFEQLEQERQRRFGASADRTSHFGSVVREALRTDPYVRVEERSGRVDLVVRNALADEHLNTTFPLVDR